MGINHYGFHLLIPQQLLHYADVIAILSQNCRKTVAKRVTTYPFFHLRRPKRLFL